MGARRFLARLARAIASALDRDGKGHGNGEGNGELRAVEEALETERERLRLVMRATQAGIVDWDIATGAVWYSGRLKRLLGYGSHYDSSRWTNFSQFVHPEDREQAMKLFIAELKSGAGAGVATSLHKPMEFRMQRADGSYLWVQSLALTQHDASGRARRDVAAIIDITARRAQEERLRESDARHDLALRATNEGVYDWNIANGTVFYSENVYRVLGAPAAMKTPEDWRRRIHPDDLAAYDAALIDHFKGKTERFECTYRYVLPDGSWRWARQQGIAVRNAAGRAVRMIGATGDITALKVAESELARRAKFVEELVDVMPISIAMRDAEGRYVLVNRTWERYFGVKRADAIGKRRRELPGWPTDKTRVADAEDIERIDREMLARGPEHSPEAQEVQRLGRYYLMTRRALFDSSGRALGVVSAGLDVTERRATEERLRDQMALTRALIDDNPNAMYLKDTQGRYMQVNDAWLSMVGVTREQALGRNVRELFPEQESDRYHAEDMRLLEDGGSSEMESLRTGPDGKAQWVIIRKAVLTHEDGSVAGLIGTNTDVTRLKEVEARLAFEQRRLDLVVRASQVGIVDWDGRTHATFYSPRFREILGHAPDADTSGWPDYFKVLIHPDDRERVTKRWITFIRGKEGEFSAPEEYRLLRADGAYAWVSVSGIAVRDATGFVTRWIAATTDITERRTQEEALATEQKRLALVVHSAKVGILDWDGVHRTAYYSPRFKEILGHAPDADTSGWPDYFDLVHPEDRERVHKRFREHIVSTDRDFHEATDYRLRRADGSYVWIQAQGITVRDEKNYATRFIATLTDITERRAQEEALRESVRLREEVERMSRHDLKTPLNSVIAVSRLLREGGNVSRDDEELLSIVERAGYRILSMVNLSLDLFRMEQGSYQFRPQAIDLADVVHKVAADLESQAASKGVALVLRQSGRSAARAEELLSYSMLANLVKNAIEAEPEGGTVAVTVEGAGPRVSIHVHNSGVVAESVRSRFFEKYATTGKSAGLGLGTYSALLMARVQEGDITLHSTPEAGTTVSVRLHAADDFTAREERAPAATASRTERLPTLPPLRVLMVDDDEFNRLVLRRYLPTPPLTLDMAVNGRAALDAARENWPDVVLLDLEMPVMDGYEAAMKLRAMEKEGRRQLRIIAISSNDDPAIMARARAAGCDQYLVKPAPRETLWKLIAGEEVSAEAGVRGVKDSDTVEIDGDLRATLPEFLRSRRVAIDEMHSALAANNRTRLKKLAHKLAGSFSMYGFKWAATECLALERAAAADQAGELGRRVAGLRAHLDGLDIRWRETKREERAR